MTVFAMDNSLSMRAGDRLAHAKQLAKSEIAALGPGQRGQMLAFGSRVQAMSEVTDDHAPLGRAWTPSSLPTSGPRSRSWRAPRAPWPERCSCR